MMVRYLVVVVLGLKFCFHDVLSIDDKNVAVFGDDDDVSCDPQIADTCFSDVEDDFRLILDPTNGFAQASNITLLRDLCSAWNDSLSCTSDIIDEGCQVADGRVKFDHWNSALRETWNFVCRDDFEILRAVLHGMKCFNISAFFYCIETTADLKTIQDLMKTELDAGECWHLKRVIQKCGEYVTELTCSLEVMEPLSNVLEKFFKVGNCETDSGKCQGQSCTSGAFGAISATYLVVSAIASLFTMSRFT